MLVNTTTTNINNNNDKYLLSCSLAEILQITCDLIKITYLHIELMQSNTGIYLRTCSCLLNDLKSIIHCHFSSFLISIKQGISVSLAAECSAMLTISLLTVSPDRCTARVK